MNRLTFEEQERIAKTVAHIAHLYFYWGGFAMGFLIASVIFA